MKETIQSNLIENQILLIHGHKVMLSNHLAELYDVKVKTLIQAIKRNRERFPKDFMFQLSWKEAKNLRSQIVTLEQGRYSKYQPYAFTEQGIAMLSSVLRSKKAIRVNIAIMRTFVKLKEMLLAHKELAFKLHELERRLEKHDGEIRAIFRAIRELMAPPPEKPKGHIGFHP